MVKLISKHNVYEFYKVQTNWGGVICSLLFSCQKENDSITSSNLESNHSGIHPIEAQAYQHLSKLTEPERLSLFQREEARLKNQAKFTAQDQSLDNAFISLEGVVNGDFHEEFEDFELIEVDEATIDLPYYETESGKYVDATDYLQAYADLHNVVNNAVDTTNKEDLLLLDLEIGSLDEQNQVVVINTNAVVASLQQNQWFTPGEPYWAAAGAGACSTPPNHYNQGTDVADFMRAYANSTADWKSRCPNGIYLNPGGRVYTYRRNITTGHPFSQSTAQIWQNQIVGKSWRSNSNDCLGNTNAEWQGRYADMDAIIAGAESVVHTARPKTVEFYITDWHSHIQRQQAPQYSRFAGNHDLISEKYFHAGMLRFATITCKP